MKRRWTPLRWLPGERFDGGMARTKMATHTMWRADESSFRCANSQLITLSPVDNTVLKVIAMNANALGCMPIFEEMYCGDLKAMRAKLGVQIARTEVLVRLGGCGGFQLRAHAQHALLPAEPYVLLRLLIDAGEGRVHRDPWEGRVRRDPVELARIFPLPIAHQFFGTRTDGRWSAALDSSKAVKSLWYHCRRIAGGDGAILPLEAYTRGFFCDAVLESLHRILCVRGDDSDGPGGRERDASDGARSPGGAGRADPWGLFAKFISAISCVLLHARDATRGSEYRERKRLQQAASCRNPRGDAPDGVVGMPDVILWTDAPRPGGRGAEVRFVEVKTNDRLSASQRAILRGLGCVDVDERRGAGGGGAAAAAARGANGARDAPREESDDSDDSDDSACAKAELVSERKKGAAAGEGGLEAAIATMRRVVAEYAKHGVTITGALQRCQCSPP